MVSIFDNIEYEIIINLTIKIKVKYSNKLYFWYCVNKIKTLMVLIKNYIIINWKNIKNILFKRRVNEYI